MLLCLACSSNGTPGAEPVGWITGREALQKMMQNAKQWSPDAEAIRLYSGICKNARLEGLCDDWRAVVVSASRRKSAGFYWSRAGIRHNEVADYDGQSSGQYPIDVAKLRADSDTAFRVTKEHGGKPLLDKNPQIEIRYAMEFEKRIGQLIWLVF